MVKEHRNHFIIHLTLSLGLLLAAWTPAPVSAEVRGQIRNLQDENTAPFASTPKVAAGTLTFTNIAVGASHTCAIVTGGGVKCWGSNTFGQLGNGTTTTSSTPVQVTFLLSGVTAIAAGSGYTCALDSNGGVKCWGSNTFGQLGDGTTTRRTVPVRVSGLSSGVTAIAAGGNHTCARLSGGEMKCWGSNSSGQLGDGTTAQRLVPVDVKVVSGAVSTIAAGMVHTCALLAGGGMKCWGANDKGQLGRYNMTAPGAFGELSGLASDVFDVATGAYHTCAVLTGGGVQCWGYNRYGQLGNGTIVDSGTPVVVSGLESGVTDIIAGDEHTCALVSGGGVKCWGGNGWGQLGDDTTRNRSTPVQVIGLTEGVTAIGAGEGHTCALVLGGEMKCWGSNSGGQLGVPITKQRSIPMDISGLEGGVTAVTAGWGHTCTLGSGIVTCWGLNDKGQLGDGFASPFEKPGNVNGLPGDVTAINAGGWYTCGRLSGGGVKCWGSNYIGQLGDGTSGTDRTKPVDVVGLSSGVTAIAAGYQFTCVRLSGGRMKCWGANFSGQLGDGTKTNRLTPVDVVGMSSGVIAIAAGAAHVCALVSGGGVKCWGWNSRGQLGNGSTTNSSTPVAVIGLSSGVTGITAGSEHTCARLSSGGVKCWGANGYGQLGDGTTTPHTSPVNVNGLTGVTAIAAGEYHTCTLLSGDMVKCWGDNQYGQLGDGTTELRRTPVTVSGLSGGVTAITSGQEHTCALVGAGRPKCWGWDNYGQLGIGLLHLTPVDVDELGLPSLTVNYAYGQPGSFITLTGWNFPPGASVNLSINGRDIIATLAANPTGSFIVFLDTREASPGSYTVTASANLSVSTSFLLDPYISLHPQEGGGQVINVPAGIAFRIYLPQVSQ